MPRNFIFISPNFPPSYWNFCDRLKKNGVNVLGVGDASYDTLWPQLRECLTEYYRVNSLEDYDEVYRAVAFFCWKYGRIDWIESMNEYWLAQDARLRTDFNVTTGVRLDQVARFKKKSVMHAIYRKAGIPTARQRMLTTLEAAKDFAAEVGYPLIAKPDVGVGATNTWKIRNQEQLELFFARPTDEPFVLEEFVDGIICSYDAITDSHCKPLFESMTRWPGSIRDIVTKNLDLSYVTLPSMPESLRLIGRRTLQAFGAARRYVHLEFFCLVHDHEGLGKCGDYVALEVNMRPAGGFTTDMMNFAHSTDTYQIYADMVTRDRRVLRRGDEDCFCVYAGRRQGIRYVHNHDQIMGAYGRDLVMTGEMPPMNWPQMGRWMYTARFETEREIEPFLNFVLRRS